MARALHDIQSLLLLLPVYDNILVIGIKAMVGAPEVAAAAVAVAMVAEDGLEAARWSCLPIKVYALPKYLSFLQTLLKGYSIEYVVLLRSANDHPTQLICLSRLWQQQLWSFKFRNIDSNILLYTSFVFSFSNPGVFVVIANH